MIDLVIIRNNQPIIIIGNNESVIICNNNLMRMLIICNKEAIMRKNKAIIM